MQPLSVELGPGLLTTIFDGIQRPLKAIALSSGDCFIPRGVDVPALDRKKHWEFNPGKVKVCFLTVCATMHSAMNASCLMLDANSTWHRLCTNISTASCCLWHVWVAWCRLSTGCCTTLQRSRCLLLMQCLSHDLSCKYHRKHVCCCHTNNKSEVI